MDGKASLTEGESPAIEIENAKEKLEQEASNESTMLPLTSLQQETDVNADATKQTLADEPNLPDTKPETRVDEMRVDGQPGLSSTEVFVKTSPVDEGFPEGLQPWQVGASLPSEPEVRDSQDASPGSERPLNVTDALSYLDAVKKQFHDRPDVYNRFLDIMKDFKNQSIDTPGVIERVSTLFAGYPRLIEGFNTFLPHGYHIECTVDLDTNVITVTTPEGTTTRSEVVAPMIQRSNPAHRDPKLSDNERVQMCFEGRFDLYREFANAIADDEHPVSEDPHYVARKLAKLFENMHHIFDYLLEIVTKPDIIKVLELAKAVDMKDKKASLRILPKRKAHETDVPGPSGQKRKRKTRESGRERVPEHDMAHKMTHPQFNGRLQEPSRTDIAYVDDARAPRRRPDPVSDLRTPDRSLEARPTHNPRVQTAEDYTFFERVKMEIDNRETYNEFLKLINYFTQGIIDMKRLVEGSRTFLNEDLMAQFKKILGWDSKWDSHRPAGGASGRSEGMERVTRDSLRIRHGPSYRRLPADEANAPCSGRDDMCRSVLNDEWVSHPTWASEDSGFVGHRKNVYEEALHRSEEERHEYDFHIEAIVRTLSLLEPLHFKIMQMQPEERPAFKTKLPFSGVSRAVFHRIIKKIYGRDAGLEVIQCVHDQPGVAIPIVFSRLRQKESEWKKAQRQWNKVWREVDARNYQKSLDHQGITFKASDKKAITAKTFLNQLESARDEQLSRRASLVDPTFARTRPRYHMAFTFDDTEVLQDVFKLTFSLLDRMHHHIATNDRRRIEGFLRTFIPIYFMFDPVAFNDSFQTRNSQADFPITDDFSHFIDELDENASTGGGSRSGRNARRAGNDLRRKLLKNNVQDKKKATQNGMSRSGSPVQSPATTGQMFVDETPPSSAGSTTEAMQVQPKDQQTRRSSFFSNAPFYTLLRLIEVLYSRLKLCKDLSAMLASDPTSPYLSHPIASELALLASETSYPKLAAIQKGPMPATHFYPFLLETCEKLFDNAIDQATFEEILRGLFGTKAFIMFTIDKVIGALIKQVQSIITDSKSLPILDGLKREREMTEPSILDFDVLREGVEKVIGSEENLFRLDWTPTSRIMTIQLLGKDDANFDDVDLYNGRWQAYMDSFVSDGTTKGMENMNIKPPFLSRNYRAAKQPSTSSNSDNTLTYGTSALEIKICVRTYRMFFVSKTEDCMWRLWGSENEKQEVEKAFRERVDRSEKWLKEFDEKGVLPGSVKVNGKGDEAERR